LIAENVVLFGDAYRSQ